MNILTKDVPRFDPQNVNGSLQAVYNYLSSIMEQVDYTLTKYSGQLGKSSLPETSEQVKELLGRISALSSAINGIAGRVDILDEQEEQNSQAITEIQTALGGITGRLNGIDINISNLRADADALDQRILKLEQQEGA